MDSTEIGCILAGALAIGVLSSQMTKTRGPRRSSYRSPSACHSMRSTATPASSVSAKASTVAPSLTQNLNDLFKAEYSELNDPLVKTAATAVQSKATAAKVSEAMKQVQPVPELTTTGKKDVGSWRDFRLGGTKWEMDPNDLPTITKCTLEYAGASFTEAHEEAFILQGGTAAELTNGDPETVAPTPGDFSSIMTE